MDSLCWQTRVKIKREMDAAINATPWHTGLAGSEQRSVRGFGDLAERAGYNEGNQSRLTLSASPRSHQN
jgi:hypothetical protein